MKRFLIILLSVIMSVALILISGCSNNTDNTDNGNGNGTYGQNDGELTEDSDDPDDGEDSSDDKTDNNEDKKEITKMYVYVNGNKLEVTLAENSSVEALVEILKQGDIVYTAYGNSFEIYGDIGHSLTTNNTQITSEAGDVLLWAGSNICIFFGHNPYSYTRIGKISGYSASELRTLLCADQGSVQVTISLK